MKYGETAPAYRGARARAENELIAEMKRLEKIKLTPQKLEQLQSDEQIFVRTSPFGLLEFCAFVDGRWRCFFRKSPVFAFKSDEELIAEYLTEYKDYLLRKRNKTKKDREKIKTAIRLINKYEKV